MWRAQGLGTWWPSGDRKIRVGLHECSSAQWDGVLVVCVVWKYISLPRLPAFRCGINTF